MGDTPGVGTSQHFTIHDSDANVPRLLAKVRDEIAALPGIKVLDMTFSAHNDGDDYVAEITVYFRPAE